MADVLVDTDVFVDHLRGTVPLAPGRHRLHYSVVTRAELFAGTSGIEVVARLLAPFREVAVDRAVAERAGRIRRETGMPMPDALIAATALEHRLGVATRNERHFRFSQPIRAQHCSSRLLVTKTRRADGFS